MAFNRRRRTNCMGKVAHADCKDCKCPICRKPNPMSGTWLPGEKHPLCLSCLHEMD